MDLNIKICIYQSRRARPFQNLPALMNRAKNYYLQQKKQKNY